MRGRLPLITLFNALGFVSTPIKDTYYSGLRLKIQVPRPPGKHLCPRASAGGTSGSVQGIIWDILAKKSAGYDTCPNFLSFGDRPQNSLSKFYRPAQFNLRLTIY